MISENIALSSSKTKGFILVIIGAGLWGISAPVAQYLFQKQGFSPEWLVVTRLITSGLILLALAYTKEKQKVWDIWKSKQDLLGILFFSIFGVLAVQYTYFLAINYSDAATATILQYLTPMFISCYLAMRLKRLPTLKEVFAIVLALTGTFLLVTQGNVHGLSISSWALFWGIASAVALAVYTLQPHKLLAKWGATILVGWGMLIGGISFSFIHPPWAFQGHWSPKSYFAVTFIIIFGTLIAYYCYLESLKYISASETSLLACVEPLAAAILSVIWLQVAFGFEEWLGTLCIISTVFILSFANRKEA